MEKDIDRIPKNPDTDIVIRIDDFGGKKGLTIREFVKSERYTGFTKSGTRVPAEHFNTFKAAINSIDEKDLEETGEQATLTETETSSEQKEDSPPSNTAIKEEAM
ncbi:MAG: hypothetical protein KJ718_06025 [Nanoarchaeota archaeon]|nr:hypothetical protein [Nanoarchaeota archaeon]MBU1052079.1 hypothetical protein [Nanoarchaeota archaeon]MBU1988185.1 hypothetical protein [Nanoarchaeota archaeon]